MLDFIFMQNRVYYIMLLLNEVQFAYEQAM